MRLIRFHLPLATFAMCVVTVSAAASLGQAVKGSRDEPDRTRRVVARGRLIGTRELQQVVTWQTRGTGHLAIEALGTRPRVLWQTDGGNAESRVDSVRVADLDADGIPEILSLWWKGSSAGAGLRVFHWGAQARTFVETQPEGKDESEGIADIQSYSLGAVQGRKRIFVFAKATTRGKPGAPIGQFDLRGNRLVRFTGSIIRVDAQSGIEGQAVISPAHPGPLREGMSGTAPHKTTLVVWNTDGDREVTRFETGSDGRFRVALPPGTYRVGPPPQAGRFLPRGSEETVTVVSGKFVRVTINFDSGMR